MKPNHHVDPEKQRIKPSNIEEKDKETEIETSDESPCYFCADIRVCGEGHMISPLYCQKLNRWLEKRKND